MPPSRNLFRLTGFTTELSIPRAVLLPLVPYSRWIVTNRVSTQTFRYILVKPRRQMEISKGDGNGQQLAATRRLTADIRTTNFPGKVHLGTTPRPIAIVRLSAAQ